MACALIWGAGLNAAFAQESPAPGPAEATPAALTSPGAAPSVLPGAPGAPQTPAAQPSAAPTQPPILIDPPSASVAFGRSQVLHVNSALGRIAVSVADAAIVDATVDQTARTIAIFGKALGKTTLTVTDDRGVSRDVPVLVAEPAGDIPPFSSIKLTGNPAAPSFVAEAAVVAARRAVKARDGAAVNVGNPAAAPALDLGDVTQITIPVIISGEGYITAAGSTRVLVENYAQPRLPPSYLMVSDFPESLKQNGLLFHADLDPFESARFLYYHYNPRTAPARRIVLFVRNTSAVPSAIQWISGMAGPGSNEMEIGHQSTERFLRHSLQDEGLVFAIPPGDSIVAFDQLLPPGSVVSHLMELRELGGATLHIDLVAQDAGAPVASAFEHSLLSSDVPHARGVYRPAEFFFERQYDTSGPNLEVPIGQIPIPEMREGQALAGDYGVLQQITIRIVNSSRSNTATIALYANPRGGRATGTFIIDGVLVRAHAMAAFGHYKLREYAVPPGGFVRTTIVTMPEGGSSYPVKLIVGPDDGSSSPGTSTSLIY